MWNKWYFREFFRKGKMLNKCILSKKCKFQIKLKKVKHSLENKLERRFQRHKKDSMLSASSISTKICLLNLISYEIYLLWTDNSIPTISKRFLKRKKIIKTSKMALSITAKCSILNVWHSTCITPNLMNKLRQEKASRL